MKKDLTRLLLLMLIGLLLVACGGSGSSPFTDSDSDPDSGDSADGGAGSVWSAGISIDPLILRGNPLYGFQLFSSPAVAAGGTIYVGSTDGILYAVGPNGVIKWRYETGDQIVASPAIGNDGTIYIGSSDRQLYAINPDGTLQWVYPTKSILSSSPAIAADGTIYVAGTNLDLHIICSEAFSPVQLSTLYAVYSNGEPKWSIPLSGPANSSPVIANDGIIYIGTGGHLATPPEISYDRINPCDELSPIIPNDVDYSYLVNSHLYDINPDSYPVNGHLYAIYPNNGAIKWDFKTLGNVDSSAAIGSDGTIYVGSDGPTWAYSVDFDVIGVGSRTTGFLYAIDPNEGVLKWYTDLFGNVKSSPAIGSDGTIYVGSDKEDVFALNPDGTIKWVFPTRGPVRSSPALAADGTIYIGSNDSRLYALNPDGTLHSLFLANAAIASSPSIIADGTIYFATGVPASDEPFVDGDATLYSISGNTALAEPEWPKFLRNLPNTGRQ